MAGPDKKILLIALLTVISAFCCGCIRTEEKFPRAQKGVLDLSATDMPAAAMVSLDGEWEFYWNRLLSPDDFRLATHPLPSAHISLPDKWNNLLIQGKKVGAGGYATYRLVILPGRGTREVALKLGAVISAYRLWANGKLIAQGGRLGKDHDGEIPNQSVQQPRFPIDGRPVELVLQVSNYHYYQGGVLSSIQLGPTEKVEFAHFAHLAEVLLCGGSLLIMGLYHIALFAFRRRNIAPLYFGLFCLSWTGFMMTSMWSSWTVRLFIGNLPHAVLSRFAFVCFVITVAVFYSFLRALYQREFNPYVQYAAWGLALIYSVLGVTLPNITLSYTVPPYYFYSIFLAGYIFFALCRAVAKEREGAIIIFLGFIILGGAAINDMLHDMGLIRSFYLVHMGMFMFILFQALALSLRFSRAFSFIEKLSDELAEKNLTLEEGLAERKRLERKIIRISEEERRSLSHHLHDGLCQQLTGARLLFSVLAKDLAGAKGDADLLKLSSLLEESVNQAYDLSRGLWPVEHDPHGVSPSLEELVRRLSESSDIHIQFSQERGCTKCINADITQLYRIAQEAVTNAVKHARPERISVSLDCGDRNTISLTVQDNGIGRSNASPSKGGLGMGIMAHRAGIIGGTLRIADGEGGGTLVSCVAPCGVHQGGR